jgi:hypothetical protein
MGRTACTEPQCLYSRAIPLLPIRSLRPVQSLSACTSVHFNFTLPLGYVLERRWNLLPFPGFKLHIVQAVAHSLYRLYYRGSWIVFETTDIWRTTSVGIFCLKLCDLLRIELCRMEIVYDYARCYSLCHTEFRTAVRYSRRRLERKCKGTANCSVYTCNLTLSV